MKPVDSTYEILAWKHLNRSVDEKWIDWAVDMMSNGFDTEYVVELAGISKPFNQFELKELTDKVFNELGLNTEDSELIKNYASFLVEKVLNNERELFSTLNILKDLCIELDYDKDLYDFYSLYFAKDDLNYSEMQWYWDGANRENIDSICINYFQKWITKYPKPKLNICNQ